MSSSEYSRISKRRQAALAEGGADYKAKRAEIIRTAATVFREKGYTSARLNDIATRFGTDRASLYYYFGSKEELFQECVRGVLDENLATAQQIYSSDDSPQQKLARLVRVLLESYEESYPYMYVYIQEDMSQISTRDTRWAHDMAKQTRRLEKIFHDVIGSGITAGTIRSDLPTSLITNALFGMVNWTHRWYVPGRKYKASDLADTFLTILFEGVNRDH